MRDTTVRSVRLYTIAVTSTPQNLSALLYAHIATKSGAQALETKRQPVQINIAGDADLTITDGKTGDAHTLSSGVERIFPAADALTSLLISTASSANLALTLFLDDEQL